MSAYGAIAKPNSSLSSPLPSTIWRTKQPNEVLTIHHLTLTTAQLVHGLIDYMYTVFTSVLHEGRTYPMEIADLTSYTKEAFESYFLSGDVLVAIKGPIQEEMAEDGKSVVIGIDEAGNGRKWEDCVAGFYYARLLCNECAVLVLFLLIFLFSLKVKPNYPGRSSHVSITSLVARMNKY
jgi:hypothetical protein